MEAVKNSVDLQFTLGKELVFVCLSFRAFDFHEDAVGPNHLQRAKSRLEHGSGRMRLDAD